MTDLKPTTQAWPILSDDNEDCHHVCCVDPEVTMCGFRMTHGEVFYDEDEEVNCHVCKALNSESVFCPILGECLDDE